MKKIVAITVILIGFSLVSEAQQHKHTSVTQHQAKSNSSQKGHGNDKESKDKVGPNGEKIYVTDVRYYWVDKNGYRHYAEEVDLKPKQ